MSCKTCREPNDPHWPAYHSCIAALEKRMADRIAKLEDVARRFEHMVEWQTAKVASEVEWERRVAKLEARAAPPDWTEQPDGMPIEPADKQTRANAMLEAARDYLAQDKSLDELMPSPWQVEPPAAAGPIPPGYALAPGWSTVVPPAAMGGPLACIAESCYTDAVYYGRNGVCAEHAVEMGAIVKVEPPADYGPGHCEVCGWPLSKDVAGGCVPGNCSFRPDNPGERRKLRERREQLAAAKVEPPAAVACTCRSATGPMYSFCQEAADHDAEQPVGAANEKRQLCPRCDGIGTVCNCVVSCGKAECANKPPTPAQGAPAEPLSARLLSERMRRSPGLARVFAAQVAHLEARLAAAETEKATLSAHCVRAEGIAQERKERLAAAERSVQRHRLVLDEERRCYDILKAKRAAAEAIKDRLAAIIDEAFGMQPVMSPDEMLSFLERKLFEDRQKLAAAERERDEAAREPQASLVREDKALRERDEALVSVKQAVAAERERCEQLALLNSAYNTADAIRDGRPAK